MSMQQNHLLVLDLETAPDSAVLTNVSEGNPLKPIQHRIVSLGFLLVRIQRDGTYERYEINRLDTAGLDHNSEGEILAEFWRLIDELRPRVVTWNGRGFAIPVLKQRSLVHGLQALEWHRTDPRYGYDDRYGVNWHCDLLDILSETGAAVPLELDDAAAAIGLPRRIEKRRFDVEEVLAAGYYHRINRYCESRVINTYVLYLRWAYFTSRLDGHSHNASVENLLGYLEAVQEAQPHLGEFLDAWQSSRRPCPLFVPMSEGERGPQPPESHLRSEDVSF